MLLQIVEQGCAGVREHIRRLHTSHKYLKKWLYDVYFVLIKLSRTVLGVDTEWTPR